MTESALLRGYQHVGWTLGGFVTNAASVIAARRSSALAILDHIIKSLEFSESEDRARLWAALSDLAPRD